MALESPLLYIQAKKNHLDTKIGFLKDTLRYFLFVVKSKKEGIQKINESV